MKETSKTIHDRYENAKNFLPQYIKKYIKNLQIAPIWSPDDNFFCYRHEIENLAYEFLLFDIKQQQKYRLFDHNIIAKKLTEHLKEPIDPNRLPIEQLTFINTDLLQFVVKQNTWRYDLKIRTLQLEPSDGKPNAMKHCPTLQMLWGLQPEKFFSRLRSPDGSADLYLKNHNLFLYNFLEKKEWAITTDGQPDQAYATSPDSNLMTITMQRLRIELPPIAIWSPDSKKIITIQCDQSRVKKLSFLQYSPNADNFRPISYELRMPFAGDDEVAKIKLCLIDVKNKKLTQLPISALRPALAGSPLEAGYVWWDDDSKKIYFLRESRGEHSLTLCEFDIEKNVERTILKETSQYFVEPSQLLLWENYTKILFKTNEVIWLSNRSGWPHLYLYDLKTGDLLKTVTEGEWGVRKILHVDTENRWVYFSAGGKEKDIDPYFRFLYRASLESHKIELLTPESADHVINFSPQGHYFVDQYGTLDTAPICKLKTQIGKEISTLQQADFSTLFALGYHKPEPFCLKGADNKTDIYGVIFRPSYFDPTQKYPIIDDCYPGPQRTRAAKTFLYDPPENLGDPWTSQALAELGFIVVNIDGRGTPLRSNEFRYYSYGHLETAGGLDDHITVIKKLAEKYACIDLDRVGIFGKSAGGYTAVRAMLDYPDFFHVGVCIAGNQDLRTYLAFWGEKYQGLISEVNYNLQSNYPLAKNLQGKLFLIHGDLDDNVHPANTMQLVDALIKADKDFDMLLVPNENHGIYPENNYVMRRIWDYFVEHLS